MMSIIKKIGIFACNDNDIFNKQNIEIRIEVYMAQKLIQTQNQTLTQVQRLSQQQMLQVKLLEMPLNELEESITAELDDNPALESESTDDALNEDCDEAEEIGRAHV